jgi:hypothetical protein
LVPALINCCTIDWFQDWPEEGLTAVASRALADVKVMPPSPHPISSSHHLII